MALGSPSRALRHDVAVDVEAADLLVEVEELRLRDGPAFSALRPYWTPILSYAERAKPVWLSTPNTLTSPSKNVPRTPVGLVTGS